MKNLLTISAVLATAFLLSGCAGMANFFSGVNTAKEIQAEENAAVQAILAAIKEMPPQAEGEIIVPPGWSNNTDQNVVFRITLRESLQLTLFQAMQLVRFDISDPLFLRYLDRLTPIGMYWLGLEYQDKASARNASLESQRMTLQYDYMETQTLTGFESLSVGEGTVLLPTRGPTAAPAPEVTE